MGVRGFTFVEILVALSVGALLLGAGIAAYSTIVVNGPQRAHSQNVEISSAVFQNFYGADHASVTVGEAPDYGSGAMAESMRERFNADVSSAIAVFCLGRNGRSSGDMRPSTLAMAEDFNARTLDDPEAFRAFLDPGATVFAPFTGAMTSPNSSIYILARSSENAEVNVRAIYETDLLTTTNPPGVYASVRRYEGLTLTDYYHVFYSGETSTFQPLAVFFERDALATGVAADDTFKKAANRPFYFFWWPDPTVGTLANLNAPETLDLDEPRATYSHMSGKTSFFFVVPAFPPL